MAQFDGAQSQASSEVKQISIENGVALMSQTDEVTASYVRQGYERCHSGHGDSSFDRCVDVPDRRIEEHRVTSNYKIVDRYKYADSQEKKGMLIGGLVGGGPGLAMLIVSLALGVTSALGIVSMLSSATGMALGGLNMGKAIAGLKALKKPEEFTEVRHYRQTINS